MDIAVCLSVRVMLNIHIFQRLSCFLPHKGEKKGAFGCMWSPLGLQFCNSHSAVIPPALCSPLLAPTQVISPVEPMALLNLGALCEAVNSNAAS